MTTGQEASRARRVYPLDPKEVTEEELAVVFAMTSRRPEPFDEIQQMVTAEKASDFHERWVLGYGHASVAEHAVVHLAVENVSRLACDTLEDNRLASYTEKSSRYQVLERDAFYTPPELDGAPELLATYDGACRRLFDVYHDLVDRTQSHLAGVHPQREGERDGAYRLRLRRIATDACRFVLPASTLTNVGVTMNTRSLEHAVRKLLSSDLQEERELGQEMKDKAKTITPTLVRYADRNDYLVRSREGLQAQTESLLPPSPPFAFGARSVGARLVDYPADAEVRLVAALLYRNAHEPYDQVLRRAERLSPEDRAAVMDAALGDLGPHDAVVRELEQIDYTFEYLMDYGAYREFKRHRMQSYLPQPLTVTQGYVEPEIFQESGLSHPYQEAMDTAAEAYACLTRLSPRLAEYVVTHAHLRRVFTRMNLRECYHFFKLRTQPQAHFTIREAAQQAMDAVRQVHPQLLSFINLREE